MDERELIITEVASRRRVDAHEKPVVKTRGKSGYEVGNSPRLFQAKPTSSFIKPR